MPLFTFFLECEGGTYVSQVSAPSFASAPAVWADSLAAGVIRSMGEAFLQELRSAMSTS